VEEITANMYEVNDTISNTNDTMDAIYGNDSILGNNFYIQTEKLSKEIFALTHNVIKIIGNKSKAGIEILEAANELMSQKIYLSIAVFMLIPIIMVMLSIILNNPVNRWLNIIIPMYF
jgi:hypothetical protein